MKLFLYILAPTPYKNDKKTIHPATKRRWFVKIGMFIDQ